MKDNSPLFQPRLVLIDMKLCCDRTWDCMQSREGRKRIRLFLAPFFLVTSIIFLIIGATWAKLLAPECGQDIPSARFQIKVQNTLRILSGNGCPGYDWNSQTRPKDRETAGEYQFSYSLPLAPIISATPFQVRLISFIVLSISISISISVLSLFLFLRLFLFKVGLTSTLFISTSISILVLFLSQSLISVYISISTFILS